jgi:NADPH2:quinone reductase
MDGGGAAHARVAWLRCTPFACGPAANLRYEEVDDPRPGPGQARIAVAACGVHLIDTALRAGRPMGPLPLPELPTIPGREVAGVVDAAVAMIGTGRTALAILEVGALTAEDVVLVTAAAGGLGSLLVQAARDAGATVVGVAGGPAKVQRVAQLGATLAVDYSAPDWSVAVRGALDGREVTVALDGVGGAVGRGALELLGAGGRLILFGFSSGTPTELSAGDLFGRGITVSAAIGARMAQRPGGLRELEEQALAAAADGRLVPLVQRFALAQAAAAHEAIESRATIGKTVLVP